MDSRNTRSITSIQTGIFQLIPFPFIDDWLIALWRRRMVRRSLKSRGITFDSGVPRIITQWTNRNLASRIRSGAKGVVFKPLKKVFRSVLFWLTARDAMRTTAETFFLARFLQHPNLVKAGADHHLSAKRAEVLGRVSKQAIRKIDHRVVGHATGKVWGSLSRRVRILREGIRSDEFSRIMEERAPGILADFDSRVGELLEEPPRPNQK